MRGLQYAAMMTQLKNYSVNRCSLPEFSVMQRMGTIAEPLTVRLIGHSQRAGMEGIYCIIDHLQAQDRFPAA
ncbi:hypothetical protein Q8A64_10020 [Oxalobacteraceae bacterium R-40]|uniref:Uncharacterized protein n=1 Tax=Keguizhuia sedimenti TaxID=3064264 RepID=A0ABU1BPE0_9BURK|nr:hypothetical protein [Oxalobacteraceae bacterium R-40]